MITKKLIFSVFILFSLCSFSQIDTEIKNIFSEYDQYSEPTLKERRIKQSDILTLIEDLRNVEKFQVNMVGASMEGRKLQLISIGNGQTDVLLWSQMHGDEPTATQAIFDLINFFKSDKHRNFKENIFSKLKIHFLPMLNPDGAERFARRNVLGIDINRDALRLQTPEGRTLKRIRDSLNADFGFNLHDQSTYYNAERTNKPATLSFLAPAYNYEKEMNLVRKNAMQLIVKMNKTLQSYIPGQIARYNDDFEPRAFGDNIQKWGTSTILIESGGNYNDPEKQEIRSYNFLAILTALESIANNTYKSEPTAEYDKIPVNDRMLFDLKLEGIQYNFMGNTYIIDLGINHDEVAVDSTYYNRGRVTELGDLSTYFGYETLDASGMRILPGKVYPETLKDITELNEDLAYKMLGDGYLFLRLEKLPRNPVFAKFPINLISTTTKLNEFWIGIGETPNFLIEKSDVIYAVVNGFLVDLNRRTTNLRNADIID